MAMRPDVRAELAAKITARIRDESGWNDEEVDFAVTTALDVIEEGGFIVLPPSRPQPPKG